MKRNDIDWSRADGLWNKFGDVEMAKFLGVGYMAVMNQRRRLLRDAKASQKSTSQYVTPQLGRKSFDWGLAKGLWAKMNNRELAQKLGIGYGSVVNARARLIKEAEGKGKGTKSLVYRRPIRSKTTPSRKKSK